MKWFSASLGIYILILSLLPCTDNCGTALMPEPTSQHHTHIESDHHHHGENAPQNHTDDCSPFCFCTCCGINIINTEIPLILDSKPPPILSSLISRPTQSVQATFLNEAWKPPKLA